MRCSDVEVNSMEPKANTNKKRTKEEGHEYEQRGNQTHGEIRNLNQQGEVAGGNPQVTYEAVSLFASHRK